MKKIILWAASLVALIIIIAGATIFFKVGDYYPDQDGWDRKALKGDQLSAFLPLVLNNNLHIINTDEQGKIDKGPLGPEGVFVEYRNNTKIQAGNSQQSVTTVKALRTFYRTDDSNDLPAFKIWVEQVAPNDFTTYKSGIDAQLTEYERRGGVDLQKKSYNSHEYQTYLRKDLSREALKDNSSIGGAYVFFPEKNVIVYLFLFNSRFYDANNYMVSKSDLDAIIKEVIDYATK